MSVENTSAFTGLLPANGVTTVFPWSFYATSADEIEVYVDDVLLDITGYTVSRAADGTGSVTITPALADGSFVRIVSNPDFSQEVEFQRFGPFFPDLVNTPFDRSAARDIKLLAMLSSSLRGPIGTVLAPVAALVPGNFFGVDADGQIVMASGTGADGALRADLAGTPGTSLVSHRAPGVDAVPRSAQTKMREVSVSITDYGAIPNVDTDEVGAINKLALQKAFENASVVDVPGGEDTTFSFTANPVIPDACALRGRGAWMKCRAEGFSVGNSSQWWNLRLEGINPAVAVGTKGSGVLGRTSATPDSPQYTLLTANGKTGFVAYIPHIRNGLLNGMQLNNGSFHDVVIDKAENFGSDGVFSPTEGAIIYAPVLTDSNIVVKDGAQTYGLGAVMGTNWTRMNFDLVIHDTRRAALNSAAGGVTGPGNIVRIKAYRIGGLAPVIGSPPANHNQTGCAVFWPGAARSEYIKVIDPVVIDYAENAFEGIMTVINPTVRITTTGGVHWDADYAPPNPGVFYGNQKVYGGTVENPRGWVLHAGGEEGGGVFDIVYDGVSINNPRDAFFNGGTQAPKYVHIQVVGAGNVADNITVKDIIGYDSGGNVDVGFYVQGTGGASFSSRCQVTGNRSTVSNNQIHPAIRQFGNSWNTLNNKSTPHYMGIDSEDTGGGFKRSYWGYGIEYSVALGSWRLDDLGGSVDRTLICHGNNSVQVFIIPGSVAAGALTNNDLQTYYVGGWNKSGLILKYVTTATRPTSGLSAGHILFDETVNAPIIRNAANSAWGVLTVTY